MDTPTRIDTQSLVDLIFHLKWKSSMATHTDGFQASRQGVGAGEDLGPQPERPRLHSSGPPHQWERAVDPGGVRPDRGRERQLPHALSDQRRLRDLRESLRLRSGGPVVGAGVGFRGAGGSLLSVPLSRAASSRVGALLRGGWNPRCSPRRGGIPPGAGGGEADRGGG